jgi:hypothetical protein
VNIYAEEITGEVDTIHKGQFAAVRFYLKSADALHATSLDDDRSAVTFWIPNKYHDAMELESALLRGGHLVREFMEKNFKGASATSDVG